METENDYRLLDRCDDCHDFWYRDELTPVMANGNEKMVCCLCLEKYCKEEAM